MSNVNVVSLFTNAKNQARDILRAQMAGRIQGRLTKARELYKAFLLQYANYMAEHADAVKAAADRSAEEDARLDARRQTIGSIEGLTAEELEIINTELATEDSNVAGQRELNKKAVEEAHEKTVEYHTKNIESVRADLVKYESYLEQLSTGNVTSSELKVSKDEMNALANKLVEEGRVSEPTA